MYDTASPTGAPSAIRLTAVSYLRVSTKEQAERDGDPEGYSLPAQREANRRKAESLGADIVEEFVDRGESARSADRPDLQRMLQFIAENPVNFVIVHKVDRLARSRADDVTINLAIQQANARLVSVSENIDETPSGMLLHGIMSSIAEFYSRNLANEVVKGMSQKAKTGGTTGKAPLGYRNRSVINEEGREVRTVVIDEERAPLIRWAFTAYASGEFTLTQLVDELTARGLATPPTPKRAAHAVKPAQLYNILTNPYYLGIVKFQGVSYPGRHAPLTDESTWQKCQQMFESRSTGEKSRVHNHYLKSSVYCGQCESRLIIHYSKNAAGVTYPYFVCVGRHQKRTDCTMSAVNIHEAEQQIENLYKLIALTPEMAAQTRSHLRAALEQGAEAAKRTQRDLLSEQTRLMERSKKLLDGHLDGTIPGELYRDEQERINRAMAAVSGRLDALQIEFQALEQNLDDAVALIENCYEAYRRAPDGLRRTFNQAFFTRILITREEAVEGELAEPFATVSTIAGTKSGASPRGDTPLPSGSYKVTCSKENDLVDLRRFELLTSSMRTRRATNCAIGPCMSSTLSCVSSAACTGRMEA